jgi:hypothetical protein
MRPTEEPIEREQGWQCDRQDGGRQNHAPL